MIKSFLAVLTNRQKKILVVVLLVVGFQFVLMNDQRLVRIERDEYGHLVRPANCKTHYLSLDEFNDTSEEATQVYNKIKNVVDNEVVPAMDEAIEQFTSIVYNPSKGLQLIKDTSGIDVSNYLNIAD